jgi:histidyl-tRNA synthetase
VPAIVASGERSLKAQMRQADALGAAFVAIIGQRELAEGSVTLKRLADGTQETVAMADVAGRVREDKG